MNEKRLIEQHTAEGFLRLYNFRMGTSFRVIEIDDAPDVICEDKNGNILRLEITLSQDREGDIQAKLGRSNSRDFDVIMASEDNVDCLNDEPCRIIIDSIKKKLNKDYGKNVALIVRHASGLDWNFDLIMEKLRKSLDLSNNNFDKGIWIISNSKEQIYKVC